MHPSKATKSVRKESELAPYLPIYGNHLFNIFKKGVNVTTGPVCNWSQALADASIDGGDTLVVGMTQELAGLFSPLYAISSYDQYVVNMVYQSLLAYDANSNCMDRQLLKYLKQLKMVNP